MDLTPHHAELRRLTRTDPDPRVRHRVDGLLLVAGGLPLVEAARRFGCARNSLRSWATRFLADGRDGLADRGRRGRPPKLDRRARRLLAAALASSPLRHGYLGAVWTVADLADLLGRRGWAVSPATVYRVLRAMGYRYRRPRHDLRHRQDAEAVASAGHALAELQKRGLLPTPARPAPSPAPRAAGATPVTGSSTWTSATSTPTPTWRPSGSAAGSR